MSLVVANCSASALKIVSDTRLNNLNAGVPFGHLEGALKIFLLSSQLGFAFAGNPNSALEALHKINSDKELAADLDSLTDLLVKHSTQEHSADYLAFSVESVPRLRKIASGSFTEGLPQYWIGDHEAFDCYQKHFHDLMNRFPVGLRTDPSSIQNHMDKALHEVIESSSIGSVGDFLVPVTSENGGLHYSSWARISVFPTAIQSSDGWFRMRAGTASEGSYTISMLTPNDYGIPAIAFYFSEGRFGALYCPSILVKPSIIRDVDIDQFSKCISDNYGIKMRGQIRML